MRGIVLVTGILAFRIRSGDGLMRMETGEVEKLPEICHRDGSVGLSSLAQTR